MYSSHAMFSVLSLLKKTHDVLNQGPGKWCLEGDYLGSWRSIFNSQTFYVFIWFSIWIVLNSNLICFGLVRSHVYIYENENGKLSYKDSLTKNTKTLCYAYIFFSNSIIQILFKIRLPRILFHLILLFFQVDGAKVTRKKVNTAMIIARLMVTVNAEPDWSALQYI